MQLVPERPMNALMSPLNDIPSYIKHPKESLIIPTFAPVILHTDVVATSTLRLLLNEVSCLSSQKLVYSETVYEKQQFKVKWLTIINDLLGLVTLFKSTNDYSQIVIQYQLLLSLNGENRGLWLALGHSYLLKGLYEDSYRAYENTFFGGEKCQDMEAWYIIGILYDKVSCSLICSWVYMRIHCIYLFTCATLILFLFLKKNSATN
jgi:hypothetical protein